MQFSLGHDKAATGHDISVGVTGENGQLIAQVVTEYDASQLGNDQLQPAARQYARSWVRKGMAGPGQEHSVRVVATDQNGNQENAVTKWEG